MRIEVVQLAYGDTESPADRVQRTADLVRSRKGADLVVLPELWAPGGFSYREWGGRAEQLTGPSLRAMSQAAREAGVLLHAGSFLEQVAPETAAADRGSTGRGLWNTSVVFGPDGQQLATYRKIHRFGFGEGEPSLLEAGTEAVCFQVPGWPPIGLSTCYDLRFPELYRSLVDAGAQVLIIPAAWPAARVGHWRTLGVARAIENQCLVVQCNTAGAHAGVQMGGASQVVSPAGEVLAQAGQGEQILQVDVDLAQVAAWRTQFPVLRDRRWPPPPTVKA